MIIITTTLKGLLTTFLLVILTIDFINWSWNPLLIPLLFLVFIIGFGIVVFSLIKGFKISTSIEGTSFFKGTEVVKKDIILIIFLLLLVLISIFLYKQVLVEIKTHPQKYINSW